MSADALPITASRFAQALSELPLSSLYAKHAELGNQMTHLLSSNQQLEAYAREHDDRDCFEAVVENRQVMRRLEERRDLIRKEVQDVRALPWPPHGLEQDAAAAAATTTAKDSSIGGGGGGGGATIVPRRVNGSDVPEVNGEEGVFL